MKRLIDKNSTFDYVPAAHTDIRVTFERERKRLKEAENKKIIKLKLKDKQK